MTILPSTSIVQERPSGDKPCVFIHTNHKQILGALVGAHSIRRQSRHNEKFDVCLIRHAEHPFLRAKEGQPFLRDGVERIWRNEDLQSFTPLRFMPPESMGYRGRAVFAVMQRSPAPNQILAALPQTA